MKPTRSELTALCDYVSRRIALPNEPGEHCSGLKYAREYLISIRRLRDLDDWCDSGYARCDCMFLLNNHLVTDADLR